MGLAKFCVAFLVIVALITPVVNSGGFEISGVGTTARSMGGAFRAVANDWTAAYYNPAGYARIYDNQLGVNFAFLHYRDEIVPDYRFGGYESGVYNDQVNYNKHEVLSNPSGGFLVRLPVWGETVFGLSAYQLFDNNMTWKMFELIPAYNDSLVLPNDQFSNNLDVVAFQVTMGREFMDGKMSLGLGLQLLRADLIFSNIYFRDNIYPEPLSVRPFDKIVEWNKNDGNGYGFGLNFGMMYSVSEKMNLGLNARIPFNITVDGVSSLEFFMPTIYNIDSAGVEDPDIYGTAGNLFVGGYRVVDSADFETEIKLPSSFGGGISYQVNEKLLVALDAEYTLWSKFEGLNFAFTNHRGLTGAADTSMLVNEFLTADLSNPVEWSDALKLMVGAKYELNNYFTLMGGVTHDESPAANQLLTPQFIDTGDKLMLSGGFLWHYRQWDFGFMTSYTSADELNTPDMVDLDDDGMYDSFKGSYKADTYETILSFNYRF